MVLGVNSCEFDDVWLIALFNSISSSVPLSFVGKEPWSWFTEEQEDWSALLLSFWDSFWTIDEITFGWASSVADSSTDAKDVTTESSVKEEDDDIFTRSKLFSILLVEVWGLDGNDDDWLIVRLLYGGRDVVTFATIGILIKLELVLIEGRSISIVWVTPCTSLVEEDTSLALYLTLGVLFGVWLPEPNPLMIATAWSCLEVDGDDISNSVPELDACITEVSFGWLLVLAIAKFDWLWCSPDPLATAAVIVACIFWLEDCWEYVSGGPCGNNESYVGGKSGFQEGGFGFGNGWLELHTTRT